MKKFFDTLKLSSYMSANGIITMSGWQFIGNYPMDSTVKTGISFVFFTLMGTVSKLVIDRFFTKKDTAIDTKNIDKSI